MSKLPVVKPYERFAPLPPARKASNPWWGDNPTFLQRHIRPVREVLRYRAGAHDAVRRLGFSHENAMVIASDPNAFAAVFFGAGAVAGTALGAIVAALLSHRKSKE